MELKDYWRTVRRRWRVVVLVSVLVGARGRGRRDLAGDPSVRLHGPDLRLDQPVGHDRRLPGSLFATQRVASYADLVKSRQLAERVNDDLGGSSTREDLRGQVSAAAVPETVILEITATDPDPERARDIAQAYAEGLQRVVAELETPRGQPTPLDQGVHRRQRAGRPSPVSPAAAAQPRRSPACSACCWGSAWPWPASCWTPGQRRRGRRRVTTAPVLGNINHDATPASPAMRSPSRRPRGPRRSGCCAPTCSSSTSTTRRRSSW